MPDEPKTKTKVIGLSTARDEFLHIHEFEEIRIVRLTLDSGPWLAFGKLSIVNSDNRPQNAHTWLRLAGEKIDETPVRIEEDGKAHVQAVSLQAGFVVSEGRVPLDLVCATHTGGTVMAKLSAIKLDELNPDI